tara:strand:+ start:50 stop:889 length:840 start_codon:yes stop_codon:yes gene_type:complete
MFLNRGFSNFGLGAASTFYQANSLVAKFAFLVLVLIVFIILLRLGSSILGWFFTPPDNPILLDGMIDATKMMVIPQNPGTKGSVPIIRSDNEVHGMEFTWSVWIYVEDATFEDTTEYKHIFHKGTDRKNSNNDGTYYPNNAPGLYIDPATNNLLVKMNTFEHIEENIEVDNIPLNKWLNIILRLNKQNQLDIYINGVLTKRHMLSGVAKQNYDDVYLSMNGGFSGFTSGLRYFNSAIGVNEIQGIVSNGPNMKMKSENLIKSIPRYLSSRWFFEEAQDI